MLPSTSKTESFQKGKDELRLIFETLFAEGKISQRTFDNANNRLLIMSQNVLSSADFLQNLQSQLTHHNQLPLNLPTSTNIRAEGWQGKFGNLFITIEKL